MSTGACVLERLPNNSTVSSHLGLGCVALAFQHTVSSACRLLETAFAEGITHFDTAPVYSKGYSERVLGTFLRDKRSHVQVATKFGLGPPIRWGLPAALTLPARSALRVRWRTEAQRRHVAAPPERSVVDAVEKPVFTACITSEQVRDSLAGSLRRLKTDYVDYFLLHERAPEELTEEAWRYLEGAKAQGYIRHAGVALNRRALRYSRPEGFPLIDVLQFEWDLFERKGDLSHTGLAWYTHSALKSLEHFVVPPGVSPNDLPGLLLAIAAHRNPHGKVIFGTSRVHHLRENLEAFGRFYNDPDLDRLERALSAS